MCELPASESPANRKSKSRLRFEVIEPPRIIQNIVDLGLNLERKNRLIDAVERVFQKLELVRIEVRRRGYDFFVKAVDVVGVVNAEGGLHDRQLHHKLDTGGTAQAEIRMGRDGKLVPQICSRKLLSEIREAGGVEFERGRLNNAVGATIEEESRGYGANNGNAVFDVTRGLNIAAGESGSIGQHRNGEGAREAAGGGIVKDDGLRGGLRNESNRG